RSPVQTEFTASKKISIEELRDMRILIVDDMPTNIILIRAILEHGGFKNILTADDGSKALSHLERHTHQEHCDIDLVLLDIIMPSTDGFGVCRAMQLNELWQLIPTIMITSENKWRDEAARASFENGATDIMFKPVRSIELLPRVISALTQKRERDIRLQQELALKQQVEEYRIAEARLNYLVNHDDLTGLYNRRRLEQVLELATMNARYHGRDSTLLYIDIDHFKIINDSEGHGIGDQLLFEFSSLLRKHFGKQAPIARIGADSFAVLLENTSTEQSISHGEQLLLACSQNEFIYNSKNFPITVSVGLAAIKHGTVAGTSNVLAQADQACYIAKLHGRNTLHVFNPSDQEVLILKQDEPWLKRLRLALAGDDGFVMFYQPIFNLHNQRIEHHEALIRLRDGEAIIEPSSFIAVAERRGLIHDIDRWVVRHIIEQLAGQPSSEQPCISINLSAHAFHDHSLVSMIEELLARTGVKGEKLIFEITETAAIEEFEQSRSIVLRLSEAGCRFAIDDFGTGFSSYHYLKHFPVDFLKIDGMFIKNLEHDTTNQALVKSIIEIGHTLNMQVVAEYVENRALADLLRDFGVDYLQGNYTGLASRDLVQQDP
ncbi:MAG: EAL domain-containing protein, partial [Gammaproteobacteria bacterium]|nr:EAL domain-containing protein [Gammaproteobacteria bacterium]